MKKSAIQSRIITVLCCILLTVSVGAQGLINVEFSQDAWSIEARKSEFKSFKGKPSLYLEHGEAHLLNSDFRNGIIDYDVLLEPGRKFAGIQFRIQDPLNYEEFYMRAHQSGNPDAMQYTPVFNGTAGWQLYHGEGYSAAYNYNFGEWIHVRLVVADNEADIFINDMAVPVLRVKELKRNPAGGMIGFWSFLGGAWYSNLTYQPMDQSTLVPELSDEKKEPPIPEPGTILNWEVSTAFDGNELGSIYHLDEFSRLNELTWQILPVESSGTVNLGRVSQVTRSTNTVLVKTTIISDRKQIKRLDFGYSEIASVYVNNRVTYSGQRIFRSRDYRYLGTIGYFDAVYLELKKGENEVVFAVSETSGGWGLKARLEDMDGISE